MGKISDFFKKIRDTKGISHAKMGTMKDRNASNRRKRYQEEVARIHRRTKKQQQQTNKKNLHKSDNHGGVIIHLEPDILECKGKWALRSITTNKADGDDGIPVELFQIPKDDAVKVLHSICQQIWKTQQWPQDWKKVSFHSNPKERYGQRMFKLLHNCTHLTC